MGTKQHRAKAQAEIMQAFAEGTQIEMKPRTNAWGWTLCSEPIWNWAEWEYRIAPKKKVKKTVYVNLGDDAVADDAVTEWYYTKQDAIDATKLTVAGYLAIAVPITIEVEE